MPSSVDLGKISDSVTRSLRMDRVLDDNIAKLALNEGVSVNILATQALRKYVTWGFAAKQFGFTTVSKQLHALLFSKLSEGEAREMGKAAGEGGVEFVTFFFKKFDFHNVIKAVQLLSVYGDAFEFENSFDGGFHTLVMNHGMGIRMSQYMSEAWKATFALLGAKNWRADETDGMIMIRVADSPPCQHLGWVDSDSRS